MKNKIILLLFGTILMSCHKEEIPVPPHEPGDAIEVEIEMGQDYRQQVFYDLGTNKVISTNEKSDWDLGFESSENGWHIILNTSKGMGVHKSDLAFSALTNENGLTWTWDFQSGDLDSTAFGDWQNENKLYVIDRGYNHLGDHQGYMKMTIDDVSSSAYQISYGDITSSAPQQINIAKDDANLFTHFCFTYGVVTIAPPNEIWDLVFTQYTHLFTDPLEAYVVTGVLLNRYQTSAARITTKPFNEITYDDAELLDYSSNLDYIGYDWKTYDYTGSLYTVDPSVTYIVKTSEGLFYKMHFIGFYNNLGIKGYPTFEVQML